MTEFINFGDRDNEFLEREVIKRAFFFGLSTFFIGLIFSSFIVAFRKVGPASELLDRRGAESKTQIQRTRVAQGRISGSSGSKSLKIAKPKRKKDSRQLAAWQNVEPRSKAETKKRKNSRPKRVPRPEAVQKTELAVIPKPHSPPPQKNRTRKTTRSKKTPKPRKLKPERLVYPRTDQRPETQNADAIFSQIEQNFFTMLSPSGALSYGIGLDTSGRALVASASLEFGRPQIIIDGAPVAMSVLARDLEFGLALISLEGAEFQNIPLSPAPPVKGERILTFGGLARTTQGLGRAGITFGRAGFFFLSDFPKENPGRPLFNLRGELVGLHVHSLERSPGLGFQLASDTASIYRLLRGYNSSESSFHDNRKAALNQLSSFLLQADTEKSTQNRRIVQGVGIGDFYLGMKARDAKKKVSSPEIQDLGEGLSIWTTPAPPLSLYFVNGYLASVSTAHDGFALPQGLSVGAEPDLKRLAKNHVGLRRNRNVLWSSGLEILLTPSSRVSRFVVKPDLGTQ